MWILRAVVEGWIDARLPNSSSSARWLIENGARIDLENSLIDEGPFTVWAPRPVWTLIEIERDRLEPFIAFRPRELLAKPAPAPATEPAAAEAAPATAEPAPEPPAAPERWSEVDDDEAIAEMHRLLTAKPRKAPTVTAASRLAVPLANSDRGGSDASVAARLARKYRLRHPQADFRLNRAEST